jgi:hypothetical protein
MKNLIKKNLKASSGLLGGLFLCLLGLQAQAGSAEIENQIAVFKVPGDGFSVVRARIIEMQELVVMVTDEAGKHGAWQKEFLIGMAPLFPESDSAVTVDQAREAVEAFARIRESLENPVQAVAEEESKWKDLYSRLDVRRVEEVAREKEETEAALAAFMVRPYDPSEKYAEATLLSIVEEGKELTQKLPEEAEEIRVVLEPWLQHAKYLQEGKAYLDGQWLTLEEISQYKEERLREAMAAFLEKGIPLQMPSVVVPQLSVLIALGIITFTLGFTLYLFIWLAIKRGGGLSSRNVVFVLLFGLAVLGGYGYFGFKIFSGPKTIADAITSPGEQAANEAPLNRALFLAGKPVDCQLTEEDMQIEILDDQLNQFFHDHLQFDRSSESKSLEVERIRFACRFYDDHVMLFDEVVVLERHFLIRYRLNHEINSETFQFTGAEAYLGEARLVGGLAGYFWRHLRHDLSAVLSTSKIPELYQVSDIKDHKIQLRLIRPPEKESLAEKE